MIRKAFWCCHINISRKLLKHCTPEHYSGSALLLGKVEKLPQAEHTAPALLSKEWQESVQGKSCMCHMAWLLSPKLAWWPQMWWRMLPPSSVRFNCQSVWLLYMERVGGAPSFPSLQATKCVRLPPCLFQPSFYYSLLISSSKNNLYARENSPIFHSIFPFLQIRQVT